MNMKESLHSSNLIFLASKDELKQIQPLTGDDLITMRLEKLCYDFFTVIDTHKPFEVRMMST